MARNRSEKEKSPEELREHFVELIGPLMQKVYEAMASKLGGDWFTPIGSQKPAADKERAGGKEQV